eukprot:2606219-Prymnesium_polylepis.2
MHRTLPSALSRFPARCGRHGLRGTNGMTSYQPSPAFRARSVCSLARPPAIERMWLGSTSCISRLSALNDAPNQRMPNISWSGYPSANRAAKSRLRCVETGASVLVMT